MATDNQEKIGKSEPRILEWTGPGPFPSVPDTNYAVYQMDNIAKHGDKVLIIDAETEEQRTYAYLHKYVPRLAGGLRAAGVAPGDVVLLASPNHVEFPLLLLSVIYCGATFAPVNPYLTTGEMVHVIRQSGARWVISHPSNLKNMEEAVALLPAGTLKKLWVLEKNHQNSIYNLMASSPITPVDTNNGLNTGESVALMLFSSGTTGLPKGVMLSHRNLLFPITVNRYMEGITDDHVELVKAVYARTLVIVPMCHLYGYLLVMGVIVPGLTSIILKKFSPEMYFKTIEKFKITISPVVPHIANFITKTPLYEKYDTSSIVTYSCTTAPLGEDNTNAFMERTGRLIGSGYGLTETGGVTSNGGPGGYQPGSVGKVMPYSKIKIIDVNTGEKQGENEEGEICILSPGIMVGYANNPKATKDMIDAEGWVHTGDLGYFNEENFLFITDRLKDLIKVKGFQVSPSEIEVILLGYEGVSEVGVIGVPHERTGEAPRAYVVPASGAHLQAKHLQEYVAERVAPYKQVSGGIVFVESLPRNHTGKLLRRKLKQDFMATKSKL